MQGLNKSVLLCDFDKTIVNIDTAAFALSRFADPSWRRIEELFERGEMGFEESIREEFAMINAPQKMILDELDKVTFLRPNFENLLEYCRRNSVPFTIVSAGLEFSVRHFLDRKDWLKFIDIHVPKAEFTGHGYKIVFPKMADGLSANFKHDEVRQQHQRGNRVFYVGDGLGDLPAVKEADLRFAIRDSMLAELCRKQNVAHSEIIDFQEVIDGIHDFTSSPSPDKFYSTRQ